MAKIILTSRYTKYSKTKSIIRKKYIKYIATREGVQKIDFDKKLKSTGSQDELIKQLINDFKEVKELLEYDDYIKKPNIKNASELISRAFELLLDIDEDIEKYIKYIAKRPRVYKINTHGLFFNDGVVSNLETKVKEVAEHKGIVWSHVLSLRREDAERLGYNHYEKYQKLINENIVYIAKAHKIKLSNLEYVCAFHNESYHPHIHLVVYSKDEKEGYLTEKGIDSMRSHFANCIFKNEMYNNYVLENKSLHNLRIEANKEAKKILDSVKNTNVIDEQCLLFIKQLHSKLKKHKGSKTYGWFCKKGNEEIKNLVDEIAIKVSNDENIKSLYEMWYDAKELNLQIYNKVMPERVQLYENTSFRTLQNYIIKEVIKLDFEEEYSVQLLCNVNNLLQDNKVVEMGERESLTFDCYKDILLKVGKLLNNCRSREHKNIDNMTENNSMSVDKKIRAKVDEKKMNQGVKF